MEGLIIVVAAIWIWRKVKEHYSPVQPLYMGKNKRAKSFRNSDNDWEYGMSAFNGNRVGWHPKKFSVNWNPWGK